jgi:hypothetical protein
MPVLFLYGIIKGMKPHSLKWFLNRIGKRIYRGDVSCPCHTCKNGTENGVIVGDEQHAYYLFLVENDKDMNVIYRDTK